MLVTQSCPTLLDCSPLGSSVHGILQTRILEWVAISFSRGSSWPRNWTWVSCIAGRFFTVWATREAPALPEGDGFYHWEWKVLSLSPSQSLEFLWNSQLVTLWCSSKNHRMNAWFMLFTGSVWLILSSKFKNPLKWLLKKSTLGSQQRKLETEPGFWKVGIFVQVFLKVDSASASRQELAIKLYL